MLSFGGSSMMLGNYIKSNQNNRIITTFICIVVFCCSLKLLSQLFLKWSIGIRYIYIYMYIGILYRLTWTPLLLFFKCNLFLHVLLPLNMHYKISVMLHFIFLYRYVAIYTYTWMKLYLYSEKKQTNNE